MHTRRMSHTHLSTRLRRKQFVTIQPCFENDLLEYSNMILWMPRGIIVNIQHFLGISAMYFNREFVQFSK